MKRKKWSELEEQTLLTKYADLVNSGTLPKLKTREKKFRPIADHVNSVHHHQDPITFPFKWTWRDVSIKVQNMRHQYLGVKQKIRVSANEFNWADGEIHWENFLRYKEVFGDIELSESANSGAKNFDRDHHNGVSGIFGDMGFAEYDDEDEEDEEDEEEGEDEEGEGERGRVKEGNEEDQELGFVLKKGMKRKRARMVCGEVVRLREMVLRREEKRRVREWRREEAELEKERVRTEMEMRREKWLNDKEEEMESKEMELEEKRVNWAKRELERRVKLEKDFEEERRRRRKLEEKWEEEKMEWKERMVGMQIEHEKQMMQMHANACHNQFQILGIMARLVCQFFGSGSDGLGSGLGGLPLQNLQHPGGLDGGGKAGEASPSEFL